VPRHCRIHGDGLEVGSQHRRSASITAGMLTGALRKRVCAYPESGRSGLNVGRWRSGHRPTRLKCGELPHAPLARQARAGTCERSGRLLAGSNEAVERSRACVPGLGCTDWRRLKSSGADGGAAGDPGGTN
jgi:hypothetical protein